MQNVLQFARPIDIVEEVKTELAKEAARNMLTLIGTEEVAKILGCSVPAARETMRRHDFPLQKVANTYKVSKGALMLYQSERHI